MSHTRHLIPAALLAFASMAACIAPAQAQQAQAKGEVRSVKADQGKITLRHGAISALDLPAMSLVYHADPALLQGIQAGDTVQFTAQRQGNQYTITQITKTGP